MTNYIPAGYHSLTPALSIRDAAKAIEFYQKAFGAKVNNKMLRPDGKIMHADLTIGDSHFMLGEETLEMNAPSPLQLKGTPASLFLYTEDCDAMFERAVKAGAAVELPVTDQFWGDRAGLLVDPFGHKWWIGTHKEDLTDEQVAERAKKAFAGSK